MSERQLLYLTVFKLSGTLEERLHGRIGKIAMRLPSVVPGLQCLVRETKDSCGIVFRDSGAESGRRLKGATSQFLLKDVHNKCSCSVFSNTRIVPFT